MTTNNRPSTPYQPVASAGLGSGLLGWLHSLISPATPAYRGDGQPVAGSGGVFGGTPMYRVPPHLPPVEPEPKEPVLDKPAPSQGEADCSQGPVTIVITAD